VQGSSYISAEKLAKRLDVSTSYIYKWAKLGRIPFIRLPGGTIRFASDIVDVLPHAAASAQSEGHSRSLTIERAPRVSSRKEKLWE